MDETMKAIGQRLKALRKGSQLKQIQMAEVLGVKQSSIVQYEHGDAVPSIETLRKYADYFDVSMDYIFARIDHPKGNLYESKSECTAADEDVQKFVAMCFEPDSPFNIRLKQTLLQMLQENS